MRATAYKHWSYLRQLGEARWRNSSKGRELQIRRITAAPWIWRVPLLLRTFEKLDGFDLAYAE